MTDLEMWEEADRIEIKRLEANAAYDALPAEVHAIIKERRFWEWKSSDMDRALYGVADPRATEKP